MGVYVLVTEWSWLALLCGSRRWGNSPTRNSGMFVLHSKVAPQEGF